METLAYQVTPGCCKKKFNFQQAEGWEKDDIHVYEIKEDGHRYLLQIRPQGADHNYLTSRRIGKHTGKFVEKQDKNEKIKNHEFPEELHDSIIDGEIVGKGHRSTTITDLKAGRVEYHCWDVLREAGKSTGDLPLAERRKRLLRLSKRFPEWIKVVKQYDDPKEAMKLVKEHKLEGIVRKRRDEMYGIGWDKVKDEQTFDVVIMGFKDSTSASYGKHGWIKNVIFGQYIRMTERVYRLSKITKDAETTIRRGGDIYVLKKVGRTSGMNNAMRKRLSENKEKYIGKIMEVKAQERLASGALAHPRFIRMRHDKNPWECLIEPEE